MIEKIISGGQSGADRAGWMAAKRFGIPTGGWMPRGFLTETGRCPHYAELYGAQEHEMPTYPPRTRKNAQESDITIWFGKGDTSGFACTQKACDQPFRPLLIIARPELGHICRMVSMIRCWEPRVINIAGNRESVSPGIGHKTEEYLCGVFEFLGFKEVPRNLCR